MLMNIYGGEKIMKKIKMTIIGIAACMMIMAGSTAVMADTATPVPTKAAQATTAPKAPSFKELLDSLGKIDINNALANEAKIKEIKEAFDKMSEDAKKKLSPEDIKKVTDSAKALIEAKAQDVLGKIKLPIPTGTAAPTPTATPAPSVTAAPGKKADKAEDTKAPTATPAETKAAEPSDTGVEGNTYKAVSDTEAVYEGNTDKDAEAVTVAETVKIGNKSYKVTTIADNAFSGNKKLTKITIGNNITKIGSKAFYKCTNLKSVVIGKKVQSIGKSAFAGCKKLSKVTVKSTVFKTVGKSAFKGIRKNAKILLPKKKFKAYKKLISKSKPSKVIYKKG